jgi:hypothetical protein
MQRHLFALPERPRRASILAEVQGMVEPEERERKLPMSIRLSPDGRQILDALAREKGVSRTAIIELALREYQERQTKLRFVPLREL